MKITLAACVIVDVSVSVVDLMFWSVLMKYWLDTRLLLAHAASTSPSALSRSSARGDLAVVVVNHLLGLRISVIFSFSLISAHSRSTRCSRASARLSQFFAAQPCPIGSVLVVQHSSLSFTSSCSAEIPVRSHTSTRRFAAHAISPSWHAKICNGSCASRCWSWLRSPLTHGLTAGHWDPS